MQTAKHNRRRDLCLLLSLLFLLIFNYPLVLAFNRTDPVLGIPLILLYFLGGWLLFIVVIFLLARNLGGNDGGGRPGGDGERNGP